MISPEPTSAFYLRTDRLNRPAEEMVSANAYDRVSCRSKFSNKHAGLLVSFMAHALQNKRQSDLKDMDENDH